MSLPTISVSIDCGACAQTLEHDGDQYVCHDCGLCWATNDVFDDAPAEYLDDEAKPCGAPSNDTETKQVRPFKTVNGIVVDVSAQHYPFQVGGLTDAPLWFGPHELVLAEHQPEAS